VVLHWLKLSSLNFVHTSLDDTLSEKVKGFPSEAFFDLDRKKVSEKPLPVSDGCPVKLWDSLVRDIKEF
jgi:hypothetical protein